MLHGFILPAIVRVQRGSHAHAGHCLCHYSVLARATNRIQYHSNIIWPDAHNVATHAVVAGIVVCILHQNFWYFRDVAPPRNYE